MPKPTVIAPWDREPDSNRPITSSRQPYIRQKPTWEEGSLTVEEIAEQEALRIAAANHVTKAPWKAEPEDILAEFEQHVAAMDYKIHRPWAGDNEAPPQQPVFEYKFESLFAPLEMSKEKKEQLANYVYNPPYQVAYNTLPDSTNKTKRMTPRKATTAPWTYGSMAGPPMPAPPERQPHNIWEVPTEPAKIIQVESSGDPVLDSLRMQLKAVGADGILGLARKFRIMDDDQSGTLNMAEFKKGMKECKICDLSDNAIAHLFRYFDKTDSGSITYTEFLVGVRGVLNKRRREMVHMAFDILDVRGVGECTVDDMRTMYNAKFHPDVLSGKYTEEEVLTEYMSNFELSGKKDGIITLEEFENYYCTISASIDRDDYFELMMRNAWGISGGIGVCENSSNKRILVTQSDGTQRVEEVQKQRPPKPQRKPINALQNEKMATGTATGFVARLRAQSAQQGPETTEAGIPPRQDLYHNTQPQTSARGQQQQQQQQRSGQLQASAPVKPKSLAELASQMSISQGGPLPGGSYGNGRPPTAGGLGAPSPPVSARLKPKTLAQQMVPPLSLPKY